MNKLAKPMLFLLFINFSFSQNYTVSYFQKINEINGGFSGVLNEQDNFGVSIDEIGDLDNNGVNDLVVGAFLDNDGGSNRGAVWILFLDIDDQVISHTKISSTSGNFSGILENGDRFGSAVSHLGDINNDGLTEVAVGAEYDGDGGYGHGAIWILSLNNDGTVNSFVKISDTEGNFNGGFSNEVLFGSDIENIGDLNGDGIVDLAVGIRQDNDGGETKGAIAILFLNNDLTVNYFQKISENQGDLGVTFDAGDFFGASIANIGDLNGDGVVDIAVGSNRDDDVLTNSGSIYILFLNTNGTVSGHQKISNDEGGLNSIISSNALFGESIDGIVDIDGDGKIEIVVGAMNHINPTFISLSTGAFFVIELNNDGTVSEEHFYSYRENCFLGQLEHGILFGGSVSFLNSDPNNLKIAVGSYRDSENGYRKGAAYILTLGELAFNIVSYTDPNGCGSNNGTITISGFSPNIKYTVSYDDGTIHLVNQFSDANGDLTLTGLTPGVYNDITVNPDLTDCSFNLGQVTLNSTTSLTPTLSFTNPSDCNSNDGNIIITGLSENTEYNVSFNNGSIQTVTLFSDASGELVVTGLESGVYDDVIAEDVAGICTYSLGQVTLTSSGIMPIISFNNPTNCSSDNGSFTISGLVSNTEYTVAYNNESFETITLFSNVNGVLNITGLISGQYNDITIEATGSTSCLNSLGQITLISSGVNAIIAVTDPTDCNTDDGNMLISGLLANTEYAVSYNSGTVQLETIFSNANGEITIGGLSIGLYNDILIVDTVTNCSDNVAQISLNCVRDERCFKTAKFFTPNSDGENDVWRVKLNPSGGCDYTLYIYDRYGKLLKTLTPQNNFWDGTFRGENMATNDYWYVVEYIDEGQLMSYRSHFTLKR